MRVLEKIRLRARRRARQKHLQGWRDRGFGVVRAVEVARSRRPDCAALHPGYVRLRDRNGSQEGAAMNTAQLRTVFEMLMRHVENVHKINDIPLGDNDCYWSISTDDWFDLEADPEVIVGSLVDDLAELEKLPGDSLRVSANDLDRLASVLRLLSYQVSS
jgi:hypothetical protein